MPSSIYDEIVWQPLLTKEEPFSILATSREWMAAEKLHSLVSRGEANTRLKDFYDLATKLLVHPDFHPEVLRAAIEHVFVQEFNGRHPWPVRAYDAVALISAFGVGTAAALLENKK